MPSSRKQRNYGNSYLILDEKMQFLNCRGGKKVPGRSILEPGVTVKAALAEAGFEDEAFIVRDGIYSWSREREIEELDW